MTVRLRAFALGLSLTAAAVFAWSGWNPRDRFTWLLEVAPAIAGALVLAVLSRRGFTFTRLACVLLWLHAIVLLVGGHYTYAEVPLFNWIRDSFGLARNHYDRVGHFMQGFVPAIVAREVLLRLGVLRRPGWLFFLVVSVCLAISAAYELVEWAAAVFTGEKANDFLGTQGDPWDTQTDMALALAGAALAQVLLGAAHDRQLERASRP